MKRLFWSILGILGLAVSVAAQRLDLSWPTPDPAFEQGKSGAAIYQDTGTGDPSSGGFGGVRSSGRQFHEGIDIKAMARDRRGKAQIFAGKAAILPRATSCSKPDKG